MDGRRRSDLVTCYLLDEETSTDELYDDELLGPLLDRSDLAGIRVEYPPDVR